MATIWLNGLLAGLYLAFACGIAPAFQSIDDVTYVRTFRLINRRILNPWFLTLFFLAPLSAIVLAALWIMSDPFANPGLFFAGVVCALSMFFITVLRNVPLNNALERTKITEIHPAGRVRAQYENQWNAWNLMRTLSGVAAVVLLMISLVIPMR